MSFSIMRCGECRKLRAQDCAAAPAGGKCCEDFEPFGEWLLQEIRRAERHLRHTKAWAGLLIGAALVSIFWVLNAG